MAKYKANPERLIQLLGAAAVSFLIFELLGVFH